MELRSADFAEGENIPPACTCDGENRSPRLSVSMVPGEAKALALIVDDPDAPAGTWVHWLLWNIPPETTEIVAGTTPGIKGTTSFGKRGYGGPCPPSGVHRYFFRLFTLDSPLTLHEGASRAELDDAMKGHILAEAVLMGRYQRR